MSKVATYLQEHILGEVTTNPVVLTALSHDASVLKVTPEMAVYPRVTNDIRKIARFAWQLAEKGHVLPITARGGGTDQTGGAIGRGVTIVLSAHMNRILELDAKQKLVRLQPGVNAYSLNNALMLQGVGIPSLAISAGSGTVGGAVMKNTAGPLSGKYGDTAEWTSQLEVVLANGDLLQTGRISKRELNKRKGLQTFEGEIYRKLDNLIEDNKELIETKVASDARDNAGYSMVANVKKKDGSFDLTPLFAGSQGTLGIVSEMIMKAEFMSAQTAVAVVVFSDREAARDALDQLRRLEPAFLDYYDGAYFELAAARGKKYGFMKEMKGKARAVLLLGFDEFGERARMKKLKRLQKILKKTECYLEAADGDEAAELRTVREVSAFTVLPESQAASAPPLFEGAFVPDERFEEFSNEVTVLSEKHRIILPLHARMLEGLVYVRPVLHLHKVSDKQKVFKLLDEYSTLVGKFGGHLIGEGGEGRMKARFAQKVLDPEIVKLFTDIKEIFDPHGILNPEVKQAVDVRQLVSQLRPDYTTANNANFVSYN